MNNYLGITVTQIEELLADLEETVYEALGRLLVAIEETVDMILSAVHDTHIATECPCSTQVFIVLLPWQQQSLTTMGRCPPGYHHAGTSAAPAGGAPSPALPGSSSDGVGSGPAMPAGATEAQVVQLLKDLLRRLLSGAGGVSDPSPIERGAPPGNPAGQPGGTASGEGTADQVPTIIPPGCVPDGTPDFGRTRDVAGLGDETEVSQAAPRRLTLFQLARLAQYPLREQPAETGEVT